MAKVRIVGLGVMEGDEICELTSGRATGYIAKSNLDMSPCNLKILGPGKLGDFVDCPQDLYDNWVKKNKGE